MIDPADLRDPEAINRLIQATGVDTNKISDGKNTFGELYERIADLEAEALDIVRALSRLVFCFFVSACLIAVIPAVALLYYFVAHAGVDGTIVLTMFTCIALGVLTAVLYEVFFT